MKKFFVALFSVVSLLAVIVPSSASAIKHPERETNAQRFARGLPPNPPTRRSTAFARRQSPTPPCVHLLFLLVPCGAFPEIMPVY
jgi:hypothetical protein